MLPYGPRTNLGINERGLDRRAGTRWAGDVGDLSRSHLARARRHGKTKGRWEAEGGGDWGGSDRGGGGGLVSTRAPALAWHLVARKDKAGLTRLINANLTLFICS